MALASGIDGLIVVERHGGAAAEPEEPRTRPSPAGSAGRCCSQPSTALLAEMYRLTGGKLPLIGTGGIASGADAYAKIRAGASLVQLYTALVYHGPGLVGRIKHDLAQLLARDGYAERRGRGRQRRGIASGMSLTHSSAASARSSRAYDGLILDLWGVVHDGNAALSRRARRARRA